MHSNIDISLDIISDIIQYINTCNTDDDIHCRWGTFYTDTI